MMKNKNRNQKGLEGMTWPEPDYVDGFIFDEDFDDDDKDGVNFLSFGAKTGRFGSPPGSSQGVRSCMKFAKSSGSFPRNDSPGGVNFGGRTQDAGKDSMKARLGLVSSADEEKMQRQLLLSRKLKRQGTRPHSTKKMQRGPTMGPTYSQDVFCVICGEMMDQGPTIYLCEHGTYVLSFLVCIDCSETPFKMETLKIEPGPQMEWKLDLVLRHSLLDRTADQIERAKKALDASLAAAKIRHDNVRLLELKMRCYKEFQVATGDYCSWRDGGSYIEYFGQMSSGRPHGRGLKVFSNNCEYFGSFEFGIENGQGQFWWTDGRQYTGTFQSGKPHGKGVLTWPNGQIYEGEMALGLAHGSGKLKYPDNSQHEGKFRFGVRDGLGVFTRADGLRQKAVFKDDPMDVDKAFDMEPLIKDAIGSGKDHPDPLSLLCQRSLAHTIKQSPTTYSSQTLQQILPKHQKSQVALQFVFGQDSLSAQFKELIPAIAWEPLPEVRYCSKAMTDQEVTLLMYFLECNHTLASLHLQAVALNAGGVKQLANILILLPNLTELNLSWNRLKNDGAQILATSICTVPQLRTLHVAGCGIGNNGAQCFADRLEQNECNLQLLNLSFNLIGAHGAQKLADCIAYNTTLSCLNLRANSLGPDGAKILSVGVLRNCGSLKQLIIADNQIGDEMAALVSSCLHGNISDAMKSFACKELHGPLAVKL